MLRFPRRVATFVGLVVLIGFAGAASAQTPAPIVGTWTLNLAKSKYTAPPPKSMTVRITPAGKGYNVAIEGIGPDGKPQKWSYATNLDGTDSPVTGNPDMDTVSGTGTGSGGTLTYKKAGKVVMTLTSAVAPDGKTLTVNAKAMDPQGKEVTSVAVYDRQ